MNAGIKNRAQGQERIHLLIKAPYVTGQGHKHRLSSAMNHERLYGCLFNALKHIQYEHAWVSVKLATFLFWLMSPSLPSSLPLYRMVTSVALWTLCASSPIQRQNVSLLSLVSLSFPLCLGSLYSFIPSEDHFIPNAHMYYNINNIQIAQSYITKDKATYRFSFEWCYRFTWCIWLDVYLLFINYHRKPWCNIQIKSLRFANSITFSDFNIKTMLKNKG